MRSIIRKSQFKRDFKKLRSSSRNLEVLRTAIQKLAAGEELPASCRDHPLAGSYAAYGECHLAGDWLLIYQRDDDNLVLIRTGSQTELFD